AITEKEKIWTIISAAAVKEINSRLPGKDCGTCGYPTCKDFALAMWNKVTSLSDCAQIKGTLRLELDGKAIPLVGFVQKLIANSIYGMVTSLKGVPSNPKKIKIVLLK
ncbi:MAG: (Fe-S)-binding protein, partial [Candidatus Ranarchaeia archaeon]